MKWHYYSGIFCLGMVVLGFFKRYFAIAFAVLAWLSPLILFLRSVSAVIGVK
jgi:hypothetical protein